MENHHSNGAAGVKNRMLPHAPEELTRVRLQRLGEGIGKVVYASPHWVVKRERSSREIVALIVVWKFIRKLERSLPFGLGKRLLERPSRTIRLLRVAAQGAMLVAPQSIWFTTHIREVWKTYRKRDLRGERLAEQHLAGTAVMPETVEFPPTRVRVGGWPGWLTVSEATERVECTLHHRLHELAMMHKFDELEMWLDRFLDLRQRGWQRGVFSVDAHLKNFGVTGDHVVLIDAGGLTNRWEDIEDRLAFEYELTEPHRQLGMGPLLRSRPDIAKRFNEQWKATVNLEVVRGHWPERTPGEPVGTGAD